MFLAVGKVQTPLKGQGSWVNHEKPGYRNSHGIEASFVFPEASPLPSRHLDGKFLVQHPWQDGGP